MINVNANLYRIAAMAQSHEQTRYYLCGVYIEPRAAGGATMTATDGRYLVSIFDETGTCTNPVIIVLPKHTLQSCKSAKRELEPRRLVVSDMGSAFVRYMGKDMGVAAETIVDGIYPDWRSVVKSAMAKPLGEGSTPAFNHDVLRTLCDIARELTDDKYRGVMIEGARSGSAALVRFEGAYHAFGLAMPMRSDVKPELPAWHMMTAATQQAA